METLEAKMKFTPDPRIVEGADITVFHRDEEGHCYLEEKAIFMGYAGEPSPVPTILYQANGRTHVVKCEESTDFGIDQQGLFYVDHWC